MTNSTAREVISNTLGSMDVHPTGPFADRIEDALTAAGYEIVLKGAVETEREACAQAAIALCIAALRARLT